MSEFENATPRPWRVPNKHARRVCDGRGFLIAKTFKETKGANFVLPDGQAEANAALIVAAVNSFDPSREAKVKALVEVAEDAEGALLAAFSELSGMAHILNREPATSARCYRVANALRAALNAMEGRKALRTQKDPDHD